MWARGPFLARALWVAALLVVGFGSGWLAAKGRELGIAWSWAPASVAPPAPPKSVERDRPFTLLVGAYPSEDQAREVARLLVSRGYQPFVAVRTGPEGRNWGVLVGRFREVEEATQTRDRLAAEGGFKEIKVVRVVEEGGGERR
jgi:hypothetical protein